MKLVRSFFIFIAVATMVWHANAQQTKQPYTITVYNVNQSTGVRGSLITANSQITANTIYEMTVRGNMYTPVAIWLDRFFDADFGCLCGSPAAWTNYSDPTATSADVGASSNYTRSFKFRTKSGVDFVQQMALRVRMRRLSAAAGSTPTDPVNFLLPY